MSRIGIVMPLAEQRGGAEVALLHFLAGCAPAQRDAVRVCFLEHGPLAEQTAALGFKTAVIPSGRMRQPLQWARCVAALRTWLRANDVEIALSWMAKAHLYVGPAALLAGVPAAWWQHGLPTSRGVDLLATLIPARRILACSNAAAAAQRRIWSQRAELRTIYPPIDLPKLRAAPSRDAARERLGLPAGRLVVGIVARLQRWKGVHVLLEAASELVRDAEPPYFVVVGGEHAFEKGYAEEVRRRATELGLQEHVLFAGHQANSAEWMAAMDIVVNASFGEPFGMTIIEAMALGKAVIATRLAGPLEIVTDGVDGLLVEPGNAAELSRALRKLIADPRLRHDLGVAAAERVARYDVPRFVAEITQSLAEAVQ
jgi:glycosyltransferase involved in cell wall biosynthesis